MKINLIYFLISCYQYYFEWFIHVFKNDKVKKIEM